jgi:hypothetical protein
MMFCFFFCFVARPAEPVTEPAGRAGILPRGSM